MSRSGHSEVYCDICLYMLHIVIYVCNMSGVYYQHEIFLNIDIISLNGLLSDLNKQK